MMMSTMWFPPKFQVSNICRHMSGTKFQKFFLSFAIVWVTVIQPPQCVHSECKQYIVQSGIFSSGNITSPGWPAPYPPDAHCQYRLQGEAWQGIKITFLQFDLEPRYSAGCLNDYLEINTVDVKGQRSFIGRFCGREVPAPILVLHPTMELDFRSNHAVHSNGFMATFEFVDEAYVTTPKLNGTSPCGKVMNGMGGLITSPGYPRGYAAGLDCMWLVRVKYSHAIYLRIQHLEFQGSTANCQKAQLRIYDGYEHSLAEQTILKKFCGDTRFYKGEDEKLLLSSRNRLLIRFTTTEPSKPINDTDASVGFQLVWSDVEFDTAGNCSHRARFACKEAQICFTHHHKGGTSSCPDLRHYCIGQELVCDGIPHCGENDSSDEQNCYQTPVMVTVVGAPLGVLSFGLCICFCWFTRQSARRDQRQVVKPSMCRLGPGNANNLATSSADLERTHKAGCCDCCCISSSESAKEIATHHHQRHQNVTQPTTKDDLVGKHLAFHQAGLSGKESDNGDNESYIHPSRNTPPPRGPYFFKNDLESPGASDIVSPASGFSDSESDIGSQAAIYCPAHGQIPIVPLKYLNKNHLKMLPAVQEQVYPESDAYDDGGSTYSSGQNSDQIIQIVPCSSSTQISNAGMVNEWRLRRGVHRSDAVYISDDGKSSLASSPGRICPRCMEKERLEHISEGDGTVGMSLESPDPGTNEGSINDLGREVEASNSATQFDSGIIDCSVAGETCAGNMASTGFGPSNPVKNVSFETCTSSDSAISTKGGRSVSWNKPCTTEMQSHKQNVMEEISSQTNSNSSGATESGSTSTPKCQNYIVYANTSRSGVAGGMNQSSQTDMPSSSPPSTVSQEDNNTIIEEAQKHFAPCMIKEGNNNCAAPNNPLQSRCNAGSSTFCMTVTTFGVHTGSAQGEMAAAAATVMPTAAKATDV